METKSVKSFDLPSTKASFSEVSESESTNSPAASTTELVARGNWSRPIEFILSCLNYAVGLGKKLWLQDFLKFLILKYLQGMFGDFQCLHFVMAVAPSWFLTF